MAAQFAFYLAAVGGIWTRNPALRIPAFFLVVNAAIATAWLRYARGERMTTWDPSKRDQPGIRDQASGIGAVSGISGNN
jgi:hypothetical protein